MAQQQDIISEARANLAKIDSEIEAAREQVHTLNEKIENLQRQKAQDEALIRIVDMHAQGKDLSQLFAEKPTRAARVQRVRDPNEPRAVRESGPRGPNSDRDGIRAAAKALLQKEESLALKDIAKHVMSQDVTVRGKDDAAKVRNIGLVLDAEGSGFGKSNGLYTLA